MKPLKQEDLLVLAEIIQEATFRDIHVDMDHILVKCNERLLATVTIRNGKAFSTNEISGIPMKPRYYTFRKPDWRILI
jgi:hypothetical protein